MTKIDNHISEIKQRQNEAITKIIEFQSDMTKLKAYKKNSMSFFNEGVEKFFEGSNVNLGDSVKFVTKTGIIWNFKINK